MRRAILLLAGLGVAIVAWTQSASAEKRVALVIGNAAYQHAAELPNPKNDAHDMATALDNLGFEVIDGYDLTHTEMMATIRRFSQALSGADVGLFYYAGHGLQVADTNYMVPVDAQLAREDDLPFEAVKLNLVLETAGRAAGTTLVFLDACRDNPMAAKMARSMGTRSASVGRGLARIESGVGTFIAFATDPGKVALDGTGRHSPFTDALIRHIGKPGLSLSDFMIAVRNDVYKATDGKQVPWENSSLRLKFYFKPPEKDSGQGLALTPDGFKTLLQALVKEELERREAERKPSPAKTPAAVPPKADVEPSTEPSTAASAKESPAAPEPDRAPAPKEPPAKAAGEPKPTETAAPKEQPAKATGEPKPTETAALPPPDVLPPPSSPKAADCERLTASIAKIDLADFQGVLITGGTLRFAGETIAMPGAESQIMVAFAAPLLSDLAAPTIGEVLNRLTPYLKAPSLSEIDFEKFAKFDHAKAIAACEAALRQTSDDRVAYRLARAHFASPDAAAAKPIFERLAAKGSADAKLGLGLMYASGKGVALDGAEAARLLQSASEAKNPTALLFLGLIHMFGFGMPVDADEAVKNFRQAAELGDVTAMLALSAILHSVTGHFEEDQQAIEWLRKAAAQDNLIAMAALAAAYFASPLDDVPEALRWLRKIAKHGNPYGMLALGAISAKALGDDEEAKDWFRKVEDSGSAPAMLILGLIYSKGGPVAADKTEAKRLFQKVEDLGDPYALLALALMHGPDGALPDQDEMKRLLDKAEAHADPYTLLVLGGIRSPAGPLPDEAEANRLLLKLSELDNETMLLLLGLVHLGDGPLKDEAASKRIFLKLAERGNIYGMGGLFFIYADAGAETEAQYWLSKIEAKDDDNILMLLGAILMQVSDDEAKTLALGARLLRKAADRDNVGAMVLLGAMYASGHGVDKDEDEAIRWWLRAAERGNPVAMRGLAEIYGKGSDAKRNADTAALWTFRALAKGDQDSLTAMRKDSVSWDLDFRMALQRKLQQAGVYSGPINGDFDESTIAAMEALSGRHEAAEAADTPEVPAAPTAASAP